jgi:hypothetical protein
MQNQVEKWTKIRHRDLSINGCMKNMDTKSSEAFPNYVNIFVFKERRATLSSLPGANGALQKGHSMII